MPWTPSQDALDALDAIHNAMRGLPGGADVIVAKALLYALRHPCSGPGVQRIIMGEEDQ